MRENENNLEKEEFFAEKRPNEAGARGAVKLKGKYFSVLGDSISTFEGINNDSIGANTTIKDNAVFYPQYDIDKPGKTWWMQAIGATGMKLLVNNSWSGSKVFLDDGAAYIKRAAELHCDTGVNEGVYPDIVAVYMGVNDFDHCNDPGRAIEIGSFEKSSEIYTEQNGYSEPKNFAQAYAVTLRKIKQKYASADVYVFTLPYNGRNTDTETMDKFNGVIRSVAAYFDCRVVELAAKEGYDYKEYTNDGLHPNQKGMNFIADAFVTKLKEFYEI